MKLKFKNQDFQTDAMNAVVDLFTGQEKTRSTFSVVEEKQMSLMNSLGIGNALYIDAQTLSDNMHTVQKRNNLPMTPNASDMQFCIEMETGTGKTYVYTKTIFELNRKYGFTKFIIVVPSIAIREGVYKSFEVTKEHFGLQYDNVPCRYFIYNSAKLSDVRQFATSANIEIMIINIDAFKKSENIINQAQDRLNGETAMRYIQDTHPIVIIDEPQSVDNTPKAKDAIASLNPLCVLRYSATHREKINLLYRLTPVDAYLMGLVKQISVSSNQVAGGFNQPYVRLLSVSNDKGFRAKIEIDVKGKDSIVSRKTLTVKPGDDLFLLSGERDLYEGYSIVGIDCTPGYEHIEFGNTEEVALNKAIGDVDEGIVKRAQIRRTIEAHLDKELRYTNKGIKVLSLFFIDKVDKYRHEDGTPGIYAKMFEECYSELIAKPKYAPIRERFTSDVSKVHNGYFSQDKKGRLKDTKGDTQADDDTYNTIMRDKEWLLSFDCPLRFIFSHSALKEGWDNPNVFQVCTLIDQKSTFTCRQKIGRGMRLCVNQDGERIEDRNINILHVMATESFAEFADNLQKEIEDDTGMKFGMLQLDLFSGMVYEDKREVEKAVTSEQAEKVVEALKASGVIAANGKVDTAVKPKEIILPAELSEIKQTVAAVIEHTDTIAPETFAGEIYTKTVVEEKQMTYEDAQELMEHFEKKGYITSAGKMKDTMKNALKTGTLDLPKKYETARNRFETIIANADRKPPVRDASKDVVVHIKKQVMMSPEFLELWNKIKQKTVYRVNIDTNKLIENCIKALQEMPVIPKTRLISQTADIHIEKAGIYHTEREMRTMDIDNSYQTLPDLITAISDETLLTPVTVNEILVHSGRCGDFLNNPEAFLEKATEIIRSNRHALAIDGISYVKLDGKEYYVQEIFDTAELIANLDRNAVKVEHSVYDYIVYDSSTIERPFAVALDNDPDVKMFFKIPDRFKIETPIGTYNPDWAVYLTKNGEEKLYFILETKGSTNFMDLRTKEQLKIHCGKQHFKALEDGVELRVATNWNTLKSTL
ncbi:type III restriction-modification system endonuclease [Ethanoligenens harbinense]|uniref:Type III site-specific deoxyribonuclease n=1 Tax=Ethanoligenens harbinense (strain DSM 18485 / JCM 12961 / CGMCC 1.5033 / YUAN-3) TaxID=663278 RepID=E6U2Q2_ETHHY|nr:DEAD/DEAH box helicase family protein [Ethanoligenens harbinense]ADU27444.1 Type III site-specific deoxyribonuclease [Ethanoligenens harbinense YUAN-3]AVQ96502.1 type III deoxyribonuclease [Ethanoligenens harbinense YUAN-3]AYF39164.1 type III deoxyribonuclease [Ethanoligenens harbinense]AYF41987.1 type III deoxyribonuclease [Ethanoligenens harbinense]QCN92743.1 type III deoxyribonuclease [Ethanoligenens harbinense]